MIRFSLLFILSDSSGLDLEFEVLGIRINFAGFWSRKNEGHVSS